MERVGPTVWHGCEFSGIVWMKINCFLIFSFRFCSTNKSRHSTLDTRDGPLPAERERENGGVYERATSAAAEAQTFPTMPDVDFPFLFLADCCRLHAVTAAAVARGAKRTFICV